MSDSPAQTAAISSTSVDLKERLTGLPAVRQPGWHGGSAFVLKGYTFLRSARALAAPVTHRYASQHEKALRRPLPVPGGATHIAAIVLAIRVTGV
jgi:hypothetical protein